jgi:hypothetical protein
MQKVLFSDGFGSDPFQFLLLAQDPVPKRTKNTLNAKTRAGHVAERGHCFPPKTAQLIWRAQAAW